MDKIFELIKKEEKRQGETLMMIPSENYASKSVREAVGSVLINKYSEGYAGRRYYQGNKIIDEIETLAIERAKNLFKVPYANVQPYSGSPANSEVLFALVEPGDTIMGLELASGGHLTHGHPKVTFSGKYFNSVQFGLDDKGLLDYKKISAQTQKEKPKLMLIGTTAYPLAFDWKKLAEIADSIGAWLVADASHVIGLIIAGVYPSPFTHAHLVTSTTHKTLRGPRGAMILATAKGVKNARALASALLDGGLTLVANGTECHLLVVDLRPLELSGNVVAQSLEVAGIVANRNSVPNDTMPPFYPSGLRLGTPALTTRGMKEKEMKQIATWILKVIDYVKPYKLPEKPEARSTFLKAFRSKIEKDKFLLGIASEVKTLCQKFPVP